MIWENKYLDRQDYKDTWQIQKELFAAALHQKKLQQEVKNTLLIVEHNPVFTLGKSADNNNVLLSEQQLGAPIFRIERGGDVTFHGPGQLVLYPIFDLEQFNIGLREYIDLLEQVIIDTIANFDLVGKRIPTATGVWLDKGLPNERKIAAIGVKASRYITMHGIAFNISTDLSWFQKINPCGFLDKGVTSLQNEVNQELNFTEVSQLVVDNFTKVFQNQKLS